MVKVASTQDKSKHACILCAADGRQVLDWSVTAQQINKPEGILTNAMPRNAWYMSTSDLA